jgi:tetratricopeptide (TPR) repeat protein
VLQAAVAAEHGRARTYDETDWERILDLYDALLTVWPSPVVALNRVVAVLMVRGPAAALADLAAVEDDGRMAGYRYLAATRADLLRRLGRAPEAAAAYQEALELSDNAAEKAYLSGRLAEVSGRPPRSPSAELPARLVQVGQAGAEHAGQDAQPQVRGRLARDRTDHREPEQAVGHRDLHQVLLRQPEVRQRVEHEVRHEPTAGGADRVRGERTDHGAAQDVVRDQHRPTLADVLIPGRRLRRAGGAR